ncbi:MAG: GIY-YIG nuclease family protein [Candidatus Gracilibacteria bacterium]
MWIVYILECSDNTLYTGITVDIKRRLIEHNNSDLGAKYTKARRPVQVIYTATFDSRSEASKEEYRIKQLTRKEKEKLVKEGD